MDEDKTDNIVNAPSFGVYAAISGHIYSGDRYFRNIFLVKYFSV